VLWHRHADIRLPGRSIRPRRRGIAAACHGIADGARSEISLAAKRIALGVPGSAVGLLAFQVAALPIVLAILWTFLVPIGYLYGGGVTANPLVIVFSIGSILAATAFFGTASLGGLVLGWNAANALGEGISLRTFLASDEIWQVVSAALQRPYRLPLVLWLLCVWSVFGISAVRCWLNSGATVAEVPGVYRAAFSQGPARLDLKPDGSWTYRLEVQPGPLRTGKWTFEAHESDSATVVVSFQYSGVHRNEAPPEAGEFPVTRPGFTLSDVSRDCAGKLLLCFGADERICFERQSGPAEHGAAAGTPYAPRTSTASLSLTLPAACRL
jgi:hypothetical protein